MATPSSFPPEDQLTCSICLEVYTEPVSIPCGHNFCKPCLTRHWEGKEQCQCPLCNNKFSKGFKVCTNTEFRDIVEKFKKRQAEADSAPAIKPGQVPCDLCAEKKVRASKTCLVCLVSYCDAHLEPHLRVDALKRHRLTHPVHKLEEKTCKRHNRILEFFCRSDRTQVCALCTEHSDHDMVHLDEEYVDKSSHMGKIRKVVQETKQTEGNETKASANRKQKDKGRARRNGPKSNEMVSPHTSPHHSHELQPFIGCYCFLQDICGGIHSFVFPVEWRAVCQLGVVRESMFRRRNVPKNMRDGSWIITLENNGKINKVLMLLLYDIGQLLFFDAESGDFICSFLGCSFKERLVVHFDPGQPVSWEQRAKRYIQRKIQQRDIPFFIMMITLWILCYVLFGEG